MKFSPFRLLAVCGLFSGYARGQLLTKTILSTVQPLADAAATVQQPPLLPDEINIAEADYARRQTEIELSMSKIILGSMDLPPDHRRDILLAWFEQERPALKEQEELSKSIDELYIQHGIGLTAEPDSLPLAPLERELAGLRKQFAGNPEDLRDAVTAWSEQKGIELGRVELADPDSKAIPPVALPKPAVSGRSAPLPPLELPVTGSLATMQQAMDRFFILNPPPAAEKSSTVLFEGWRDAVSAATAEPMKKINELRTRNTLKLEQQTASENRTSDN